MHRENWLSGFLLESVTSKTKQGLLNLFIRLHENTFHKQKKTLHMLLIFASFVGNITLKLSS